MLAARPSRPSLAARPSRPSRLAAAALALLTGGLLTACGTGTPGAVPDPATGTDARPPATADHTDRADRAAPAPQAPLELPGLGPKTWAQVPEAARQALVVTGEGPDSARGEAVLYQRGGGDTGTRGGDPGDQGDDDGGGGADAGTSDAGTSDAGTSDADAGTPGADAGWRPVGPAWPTHNALRGWTDDHRLGDLRSPIGVFGLTDAGGLLPDPGTRLPYDQSAGFTLSGTGFEGEPLAGSFDHVVAINYNRQPGTSPLDWTRPDGPERGGGIWLHVDHDGPTQGCVSLRRAHLRTLLRALDPELHPVVVMGDADALAR